MPDFDITKTPRRASLYVDRRTEKVPLEQPISQQCTKSYRGTVLFWMVVGMLIFGVIIYSWQFVVAPWWHGLQVHWEYGKNNVSVFGADVGHGGVSRFIAFDQGSEVVIVEVVAKRYIVYTIPVTGADNRVVTLSAKDVNGDGKPDLIVQVEGVQGEFALINKGNAFQWSSQ